MTEAQSDFAQRYLALHEQGEETTWAKGALIFDRVRASAKSAANPRERRKLRASILKQCAAEVGVTVSAVRQQFEVVATFGIGADASRAMDKTFFWHLCLMRAAHRNHLAVGDLLTEALEKGWAESDLSALGKVEKVQAELTAECPECGLRAKFTMPGDRVDKAALSATLLCPLCTARSWSLGGDKREAPRLGQLESTQEPRAEAAA